jgi:predicted PurR-regulated permease PerM
LGGVFVSPRVAHSPKQLVAHVPTYIDEGMGWLRDNQKWLFDQILTWGEDISNTENVISEEPTDEEQSTDTTGAFDSGSPEEEIAIQAEVEADDAIDAASQVGGFIGSAAIVTVLAIYFLIEGERTFGWLTRDLPPPLTNRLRRAFPALAEIVHSYILRQGLTSLICGVFTFVVLWAFGVPAAVILAILAAVADAVPFIGVAVATVPAAVVALTQGPGTALTVTLLLLAYQVFEVVFIIPRIFRRTLQLSSFGMLFAVLIGWRLLGFGGMLLALPIAAALLRIEQVWLSDEENEEELPPSEPTEALR